jgi:hypothetical protein
VCDSASGCGTLRKVSATQQLRQLSWDTTDMVSGCTRCPPLTQPGHKRVKFAVPHNTVFAQPCGRVCSPVGDDP